MNHASNTIFKTTVFAIFFAYSFALAAENPLQKVEGADDLEKVKRGRFNETYINPNVDFSHYNKLYLGETLYDYRDVKGSKMTSGIYSNTSSGREYPINEVERVQFEEIVSEAFRAEIVRGKRYEVVDTEQTDEHTLVMRGVVFDIVSRVPPESIQRTNVYMPTIGEATLALEFLDRTSGEVLARAAEHSRIGDARGEITRSSRPVNRATVTADIRRWAKGKASKLRKALDSALKE